MTFELFTKMATDGVVMSYGDLFNGMTFRDIIPENIEHYVLKSHEMSQIMHEKFNVMTYETPSLSQLTVERVGDVQVLPFKNV